MHLHFVFTHVQHVIITDTIEAFRQSLWLPQKIQKIVVIHITPAESDETKRRQYQWNVIGHRQVHDVYTVYMAVCQKEPARLKQCLTVKQSSLQH